MQRQAVPGGGRIAFDLAAVEYALSLVIFILPIVALYFFIGRKRSPREGVVFVLLLVAAAPMIAGGLALVREFDRSQHPRVVSGVVVEKLSSTGENETRTIGGGRLWRSGRRLPTVLTSKGFQLHEELARLMLTGSTNAWVIDYRYACGAHTCWERDFVSHARWSDLHAGQPVNVLTSSIDASSGRLDGNAPWGIALATLAIGCTPLVIAAVVSGRWPRRQRFVTVPAVVTSVARTSSGSDSWRVGFAYFSADGTARESADEVYVSGIRRGDSCSVVYPENQPELGILRRPAQ